MKVKQFKNKNQFYIELDNGNIYLQSYESIVAEWDDERERLYLGADWCYSRTTLKHLYLFIEELDVYDDNVRAVQEALRTSENKKQALHKCLKKGLIGFNDCL